MLWPDFLSEDRMQEITDDVRAEERAGESAIQSDILGQLQRLAVAIHAKHFSDVQQWKVGDDIDLVISQIDNMTAGMMRNPE